jgi:hypothetical protein
MYMPVLKLMGLAEGPKSDSIIRLIPLSVIPLSGAHCTIKKKLKLWKLFVVFV